MEELFLNKLAEAYQTYDASIIEDYLADDMHYASMWVFHEMTSKHEYMDYLVGKLQTMKEHRVRMEFQIVQGGMHEKALLVTNQQSPEGNFGFVAGFNNQGKVIMLNITIQAFF
jgi:hypothetical protein